MVERMLAYDLQFPRRGKERVAILRDALAAVNPGCPDLKLDYDPQRQTLVVQGPEVRFLSQPGGFMDSGLSYLRFINPLVLELRGIGVTDLAEVNGLQLLELDIRETAIDNLKPLSNMRSLRRLRAAPGQFTPEQRAALPEWVEVLEE